MAGSEDWINPDADPNGIGPVCRHCDLLIDWHPIDHAPGCPEYVEYIEDVPGVHRNSPPVFEEPLGRWETPYLARVILFLADRSAIDTFPEDIQDAIDWAKEITGPC